MACWYDWSQFCYQGERTPICLGATHRFDRGLLPGMATYTLSRCTPRSGRRHHLLPNLHLVRLIDHHIVHFVSYSSSVSQGHSVVCRSARNRLGPHHHRRFSWWCLSPAHDGRPPQTLRSPLDHAYLVGYNRRAGAASPAILSTPSAPGLRCTRGANGR